MQSIALSDPLWQATFPHRVTPLRDEWLPGLLLRCDEANSWRSGIAVRYLLRTLPRISSMLEFNPLVPSEVFLRHLSETLAIPLNLIEKTTYQLELARLSDVYHPRLDRIHTSWHEVSICLECLTQQKLLKRSLMLSYITCCPEHSLALRSRCQCRQKLLLFSGGEPFACPHCGLDWKKLPQETLPLWEVARSQRFFSYYDFFFSWNATGLFCCLESYR
jgi:hypothetical protein